MKTTGLFKAVAFVAIIIASVMNSEVKAQDNFITNEEVKNDLVVAKTIFKQDGAYLYKHMRYEFTYDAESRMLSKTASKWNSAKEEWTPYFKMTYNYEGNEIIMSYGRWNASHKAFDKDVQKSIYEMNSQNMPVACRSYQKPADNSDWTFVSYNRIDHTANLLAMAD